MEVTFFGTGAHLDPRIGISKAISELNQIMIRANISSDIDLKSIPEIERDLVQWLIKEKIDNHPYLIPEKSVSPSFIYEASDDFLTDINTFLEIFNYSKLDVLIYNLSNPDINFHTVRVIIPGLRHFWCRLGAGRLYDVPAKLAVDPKSFN